jgi:hypothetical protein
LLLKIQVLSKHKYCSMVNQHAVFGLTP